MPELTSADARLRAALKRAREVAGLSQPDLVALLNRKRQDDDRPRRLHWDQSRVSRTETGGRKITAGVIQDWLDATGDLENRRDELLRALEDATVRALTWNRLYDDSGGEGARQADYAALEQQAAEIIVFQHAVVPGLAQTPEYARRVLTTFGVAEPAIPAMLAGRMERQRILHEPGRRITFIITEAALRLRYGPRGVLAEQLDRLTSLIDLPAVTVAIVPQDIDPPSTPESGYELLVNADGSAIVFASLLSREIDMAADTDITRYTADAAAWLKAAATGDGARQELARIRADLLA